MFFLVQIKHTNNNWEKGVVVKETLNDARQGLHAYLGAYGFNHDPNTDYVQTVIHDMHGNPIDLVVDDRIAQE